MKSEPPSAKLLGGFCFVQIIGAIRRLTSQMVVALVAKLKGEVSVVTRRVHCTKDCDAVMGKEGREFAKCEK